MLIRIKRALRKFDHIFLLGGLLFLVASPIWEVLIGKGVIWSEVMIVITLLAGLSVTYTHNRNRFGIVQYIGLAIIVFTLLDVFVNLGPWIEGISRSGQVGYYFLLTITMFQLILRSDKVDGEVVVNSISGYLLMGLSWAILIVIWNTIFPGSFNFSGQTNNALFESMYFSFVTMTTLGYGDLLPITLAGKSFSMLISITGSFYTTIVLGMIVGKFISNQTINTTD